MRPCYLIVQSKNKQSIKKFSLFLIETLTIEFKAIIKLIRKKKNKKILTLLKSPHGNKTAQEQFESRLYSHKYVIYSPYLFKYALFLKKTHKELFPDVRVKWIWHRSSQIGKSVQSQLFNLDYFYMIQVNNKKITQETSFFDLRKLSIENPKSSVLENITRYLKILDIYGELCLNKQKNYVWIAQQVEQRTENPCDGSSNLPLDICST